MHRYALPGNCLFVTYQDRLFRNKVKQPLSQGNRYFEKKGQMGDCGSKAIN